jgi:hypothetical protein
VHAGYVPRMLGELLHRTGIRSAYVHGMSVASVGLCIVLWIRAKTVDQDERGNAERRALFVGLWPPTLYLVGDSIERHERGRLARLLG